MSKASRAKGARFERKVAKDLAPILGDAKRGLQFRNSTDKVQDVECPLFAVECKSYKQSAPIRKAYVQASKICPNTKLPLAVTKENNKIPLATFAYMDFRALLAVTMDIYKKHVDAVNWEASLFQLITEKRDELKESDKDEKSS